MSNLVFVSYAWPARDAYAAIDARNKFMKDLKDRLVGLSQIPDKSGEDICFYDFKDVPAGTHHYPERLREGLSDCAIGLILRDRHYMDPAKPYCLWEYCQLSKRSEAANNVAGSPKVMLVVNWNKLPEKIPRQWRPEHQDLNESIVFASDHGTPADLAAHTEAFLSVMRSGLLSVITLVLANDDKAKSTYYRFMDSLALYIFREREKVAKALVSGELKFPYVDEYCVGTTWAVSNAAQEPSPGSPSVRKTIIYSVVAANPEQIAESSVSSRAWRYEKDGFEDWKPFAESESDTHSERIQDIVNTFAHRQRHSWDMKPLHFTGHLDEDIKDKFRGRYRDYPIVFFVDPWTVHTIGSFRAALGKLTGLTPDKIGHAAAIIVWNDNDPDLVEHDFAINHSLMATFDRSRVLPKPASHRENVVNVLVREVRRLCDEIRKDSKPEISRPGSKKPTVVAVESVH